MNAEIRESRITGPRERQRVGPYVLYDEIGRGGMASVHLGKLRSASGFTRIVAIKRMHADLARSPEFLAMFFEEARLVARIQHPNVVAALDCVACDDTAMLVMEYVHGVSLDQVMRRQVDDGTPVPLPIASAIVVGAALGLHAAHTAVDENGKNLGIVHRDVSPHNILVGVDGVPRVLDFGIAKAAERASHTRTGEVKGKIAYMAPEQLFGQEIGPEADVYSLGVILWELVAGRRLFANDAHGQMLLRIANSVIDTPRSVNPNVPPAIEAIVMKALERSPEARYRTALDLATALESCVAPAGQRTVGDWVTAAAKAELDHRSSIRTQIDMSLPGRVESDDNVTSRFRLPALPADDETGSRVAVVRRSRTPLVAGAVGLIVAAVVLTILVTRGLQASPSAANASGTPTAPVAAQANAPVSHGAPAPPVAITAALPAVSVAAARAPLAAGNGDSPATAPAPVSPPHASSFQNGGHARSAAPRSSGAASAPAQAAPPAPSQSELGAIGGRE